MALFGLGKKKKESARQMPPPPKPSLQINIPKIEIPEMGNRHVDDLSAPSPKPEEHEGLLFPEIPKLDLPEIEGPDMEEDELPPSIPKMHEPVNEEVRIEMPSLPKIEIPEAKKQPAEQVHIPEEIPELEEIEIPQEIPEEIPELESTQSMPRRHSPIFINVDKYSEMVEELNTTKAKLGEYVSAAARVIEVRNKKDETFEKWRNALEDIERKLLVIDHIMFEGGTIVGG